MVDINMNPKNIYTNLFLLFAILATASLLSANTIAVKLWDFYGFFLSGGIIIFPLSYIINDVLTEVYGFDKAKKVVWLGFLANIVFVTAIYIVQILPSAPFWTNQEAYEAILGFTPRLLLASFVAYLVGSLANAKILSKMKVATQGKFLWMRTIGSTIVGEGLDSLIFVLIAFWGILPQEAIIPMILTQWGLKTAYEAILTPVTYAVVSAVKRHERIDTFDR